MYYWIDKHGNEIDVLIDGTNGLYPVEIKSGQTMQKAFFKNLRFMNKINEEAGGTVIYGGEESQLGSDGLQSVGYREMKRLFDEIIL